MCRRKSFDWTGKRFSHVLYYCFYPKWRGKNIVGSKYETRRNWFLSQAEKMRTQIINFLTHMECLICTKSCVSSEDARDTRHFFSLRIFLLMKFLTQACGARQFSWEAVLYSLRCRAASLTLPTRFHGLSICDNQMSPKMATCPQGTELLPDEKDIQQANEE